MSQGSLLQRFSIELADADRSVYETLDVRVAQHASETAIYLVTRVLAYCLEYAPGLEIAGELCVPDGPSIALPGEHGQLARWIEVGLPAAKRLHKAAKSAPTVVLYPHRDTTAWLEECRKERIHRASEIAMVTLELEAVARVAEAIDRTNRWQVSVNDGDLWLTSKELAEHVPLARSFPFAAG